MEKEFGEGVISFVEDGVKKAAIYEQEEGNGILVRLEGAMNRETANTLRNELSARILSGQKISVDLSGVTYLSASVMDILLQEEIKQESSGKTIPLKQMPQQIYDSFKARGMHELFEIEVKQ